MAFPPGFLDELRARISLADLVGRRVRLVRRGPRALPGCARFITRRRRPSTSSRTRGFSTASAAARMAMRSAMSCGRSNLDFIEAVERLAGEAGLQVPQQTPLERERAQRQKTLLEALAAAADFYEAQLWAPAGAGAREYLPRRGLDEETIRRFRLGWAPDDRQALRARWLERRISRRRCCTRRGWCAVPEDSGDALRLFPRPGDLPDRRSRRPGHRLRRPHDRRRPAEIPEFARHAGLREGPGSVRLGLGAGRSRPRRRCRRHGVIVAEGYMDVIALHRAGFGGAVAPLGTALTEAQLHELWRLAPEPVLCFDGDTAGQRAALRALRPRPAAAAARAAACALRALPPSEDPDSLIRAGGPVGFRRDAQRRRGRCRRCCGRPSWRPGRSTRRSGAPISSAG